tara:strand:+ start:33686 stop:34060 length:375 start_codon:yes stop_codon:yes gene_type:complete
MLDPLRRKEGIQRIQIGLSGLAGVVLLIGLANIVVDNVRRDDAAQDATEAVNGAENTSAPFVAADAERPTEPLAELGVTPAQESAAPVVADLQPDPNLRQPMDQPQRVPPQNAPAVKPVPAPAQ